MTGSYIRKFRPGLKHIISAFFLIIGTVLLIAGMISFIRISHVASAEDISGELKKGSLISFTLENVISGETPYSEGKLTLCFLTRESESGNPVKNTSDYCIFAAGKYRFLTVDGGVTPDVYNILESGSYIGADNNILYTGYVTDKDGDLFLDYVKQADNYYDSFFLSGSETEITDFTAGNCSGYGIRIVDEKKEKRKWLRAVPFLAAGFILLYFAGNPFFYMPEKMSESRDNKNNQNKIV
ncbi:MAG: hypothetical protein PUA81_08505 [Oscillospiraceae bacterium]|nr:hypothetical protein [Oscillospiraceae bacterium]